MSVGSDNNAVWPRIRFDFSDCQVLVTGGTSGIGAAIAEAFVAAGARVVITGTRAGAHEYDELPDGVEYARLRLDTIADIEQLARDFSRLDVLVNNAGGVQMPEDFARAVQINLVAVQQLSAALHPALRASEFPGGASVVNLASMMSLFGSAYFPGYSSAKGGLLLLTKSLATLWAQDGIRVNAVAAGSIITPMTQRFADDAATHDAVCRRTPMGRWGLPRDVAGAVLMLCAPAAAIITGQTLAADGGYSITDS
jgi:NAD(P)-dependent dehydrogenase (short-subunit alcohol dehydrogenase family)